jgi:hypothetical protein
MLSYLHIYILCCMYVKVLPQSLVKFVRGGIEYSKVIYMNIHHTYMLIIRADVFMFINLIL